MPAGAFNSAAIRVPVVRVAAYSPSDGRPLTVIDRELELLQIAAAILGKAVARVLEISKNTVKAALVRMRRRSMNGDTLVRSSMRSSRGSGSCCKAIRGCRRR